MPPIYTYVLLQLTDPVGLDDAAALARELVDDVPDVCRAWPTYNDGFGRIVSGPGVVPTAAAKPPN